MPRVLVINPLGIDVHNEHDRETAQQAVGPDTEIVVRNLRGVPPSAYIAADDLLYSPLLGAVRAGADDGFDAIAVACASDPALREAKSLVDVPVTGPFEAATRIAAAYGRFSVLYPGVASGPNEQLPQDANWIRQLAREYGCLDLLAGAAPVPVRRPQREVTPGLTGEASLDEAAAVGTEVRQRMAEAIGKHGPELARRAYVDHEAQAIFVACTFWSGQLDVLRAAVPVPVIDPIHALARYADLLARTR
ncbi:MULTISPECIES: aspartate/glutamate racemase family protein [unclassified Micromonospora]|uniref:aspartate/glutamate racemase family protein n=1 Tax=unclassified Micromonospora TaxID=2617518 RepID=UPI003A8AA918